jgi:IS30 family transposase
MERQWSGNARRLSRADRAEIERRIWGEVAWSGGRSQYRAWWAEEQAGTRARRPKAMKLAMHARLCRAVERRLERRWSPQQVPQPPRLHPRREPS